MTGRSRATVGWLLVLAVVLAAPSTVDAQQRGQMRRGPPQGREDLEQRVREGFGRMMRMRLGLEDDKAAELAEVMQSFQQDRMQLGRDEQALKRRVEAAMLEGGVSDAEAEGLLDRILDIKERELALFRAEQEGLMRVLTPNQLLQFHALREQLQERVRQLRGENRGPRRPGGDERATPLRRPHGDGVPSPWAPPPAGPGPWG